MKLCLSFVLAAACWAGTFGKVVAIGGQASDLALDEVRGVVYVANFGANRIEVISTADLTVKSEINVAAQPSSLALSPDGSRLLVTHFGNFKAPAASGNLLTVINLTSGTRQTFGLGSAPLGAAFGYDGLALVATATEFLLFDPVTGAMRMLDTVEGVTANTLPMPPADAPAQIVAASLAVSGDGGRIFGLTDTIRFRYDVGTRQVTSLGYTASPPLGPRVVSVNQDGSAYTAGWALFRWDGVLLAEFPNPAGLLGAGSHAIDSARGLVYAQIPEAAAAASGTTPVASVAPVLQILDADNLTLRETLNLPEDLAGKSVLSSDGATMYSVSASGLVALPVGAIAEGRRLVVSAEDLVFRGSFCERQAATQTLLITDPSGGATDFALAVSAAGITVSPSSGTTPASVRISVNPAAFAGRQGTVTATLSIHSSRAVNVPSPVRILVNTRDPDQRGTILNVPGRLVDILADPVRDRFYVLRQDKNQVLVYDGTTYQQKAVLRTGNTPTQMAITFDRRYLLVGNDNSQIANLYDLDTLTAQDPIRFPAGHYPRSLASSGAATLAAVRSASDPDPKIDQVDLVTRSAATLASLGPWENKVNLDTVLVASPNGASILAAQADGGALLYSAIANAFTAWRKDFTVLGGAYAASGDGSFVIDNHLLNSSLTPVFHMETATGSSSGFEFAGGSAFRTTAPAAGGPGVIARVNTQARVLIGPTRTAEGANLGRTGAAFTRTLAALANGRAMVSLGPSGLTVLPWDFDAALAAPRIDAVVNAADYSRAIAPGSLISLFGKNLNPVSAGSSEMPLPTALGESCLTVNGALAPVMFVSPGQVNAQLPYLLSGSATLTLRTPGGVSDNYMMTIVPAAPAVFRAPVGDGAEFPTVVRTTNGMISTLSNPIHRGDSIVIYAEGLGDTVPVVEAGAPAPADPEAVPVSTPELWLGGVAVPVVAAGLSPGQAGVYRIEARVPGWAPTGMEVPLTIRQEAGSTTFSIRVVE